MVKSKQAKAQGYNAPGSASHTESVQTKLDKARRDHAAGTLGTEGYIWAVMQCYAAESRQNGKC